MKQTKICKNCKKEFTKNAHNQIYCCLKCGSQNYMKNWREANPEYNKNWRIKHPKYNKIYMKKYDSGTKGKLRFKKYTINNPDKIIAQRLANKHIKIPHGALCCICKKAKATDRHHENYDKPLEVWFCCEKCHLGILDPQRRGREEDEN